MRQVPRYNQSIVANECFSRCADTLFAVRSEWDVSCSCVTAVEGPFCFAVADDEDAWVWHCFTLSGSRSCCSAVFMKVKGDRRWEQLTRREKKMAASSGTLVMTFFLCVGK